MNTDSKPTLLSRAIGAPADRDGYTPLVFVYVGSRIPDYARFSIRLANGTSGCPIEVISDSPRPAWAPRDVEWVMTSEFYNSSVFEKFRANNPLPHDFREGFWYHTAERLFILEQFMMRYDKSAILHGEIDCLFFSLPNLVSELETTKKRGVFFAKETKELGVASLLYINAVDALARLRAELVAKSHLGSEMHILGQLPLDSGDFHALPTAESLYREVNRSHDWPLALEMPNSIVDGAVIGRWLFGLDPRNTGGQGVVNMVQNHKNAVQFPYSLRDLRFAIEKNRPWRIRVSSQGSSWATVHALHVHSKIHRRLTWPFIYRLMMNANVGRRRRLVLPEASYIFRKPRAAWRQILIATRTPGGARKIATRALRFSVWKEFLGKKLR